MAKKKGKTSIFLVVIVATLLTSQAFALPRQPAASCYANLENPYYFFAQKTSYFVVDNANANPIEFEGCQPRSLWMLIRHGTRNPGDDDLPTMQMRGPIIRESILENHANGKGDLCREDLEAIGNWSLDWTLETANHLIGSGKDEMIQLGQRFRARFPDSIFKEAADNKEDVLVFRSTDYQRTVESARAFGEGLFPGQKITIPQPLKDETLLKYYKYCPKWNQGVSKANETFEEVKLFEESQTMKETLRRINKRLGFTENMEEDSSKITRLHFMDVFWMYEFCRYGFARDPSSKSAFCAAFDEQDLRVMEYHQELKYWYKNGYFYDINTKMACPLAQDLVSVFEREKTRGTFYFTHFPSVLSFLALLGVSKDNFPLRHDNYQATKERKFRISKLIPFSANVAFVLLDCEKAPYQRVLTLLQETPIQLPKCQSLLCDWQKFKEIYKDAIKCNFEEICQYEKERPLEKTIFDE